jgi:alkyl hydroperoxide reductase subunit AhpC
MISVTRQNKNKPWSLPTTYSDLVIVYYEKDFEEISTKRLLSYGKLFKDTNMRIVAVSLSATDDADTHWKFLTTVLDMYDNFHIPLIVDSDHQLLTLLNYNHLITPTHTVLVIKDGTTVFQGHFDITSLDLELLYVQQHATCNHIYLSDYC